MKAWGIRNNRLVTEEKCFEEFSCPVPQPGPHDVLVKIHAVGVNPVDTKVRAMQKEMLETPRILGWDASGEVVEVGEAVTRFRAGDMVYYAGDITRPGCNAQFQCADERLVAHKPQRLSFEEAAAMPLTTLTAWEGFERMKLQAGRSLLILGGAGAWDQSRSSSPSKPAVLSSPLLHDPRPRNGAATSERMPSLTTAATPSRNAGNWAIRRSMPLPIL